MGQTTKSKRGSSKGKKKARKKTEARIDPTSFLIEYVRQNHPLFNGGSLTDTLFEQQQRFLFEPNRYKAALCSRRAGKSRTAAVAMIETAKQYPGEIIPYIALTRQSAKNIMWPALEEIRTLYQLPMEPKESALEYEMTVNGKISRIMLIGADQKNFIDRLRGPKYPLAVIDEAGHFREHIESLVDDVLDPATSDFNGSIMLLGTPGPVPAGYFYEVTTKPSLGFATHKWTVRDNPHMPDIEAFLSDLKKKKGWSEDHPTYRREWYGEWVYDPSSLVYKISDDNVSREMDPYLDWHHVLGIDLGWHDQTAFSVLAYSTDSPIIHVIRTEGFSNMIPSDIAEYARMIIEEYRPTNIVMDTGGLGKSIAEEFRRRFHIPIKPAEKKDKLANIELFNGDMANGRILFDPENEELIHQMKTLSKADNGLENPDQRNDLCDATLYAWRECKHYAYKEPLPKIVRGGETEMDLYWEKMAWEMEQKENQRLTSTDILLED